MDLDSTRPPDLPPARPSARSGQLASAPVGKGASRISLQVILAVVAASTLVFGLSSYLILKGQHRALISQVDHQAHLVSETIKSSTRYAMLLNRREDVHQIIDTIGRQNEIDQVRVFNKEGQVIYSPDKSLLGSSSIREPRPATPAMSRISRSSGCRDPSARASSDTPTAAAAWASSTRSTTSRAAGRPPATRMSRISRCWASWMSRCRWRRWTAC